MKLPPDVIFSFRSRDYPGRDRAATPCDYVAYTFWDDLSSKPSRTCDLRAANPPWGPPRINGSPPSRAVGQPPPFGEHGNVEAIPDYQAHGKEIGRVWRELAGPVYPAMAGIGCTALWQPEAMIEILGVAVIPGDRLRVP
jgi:hypothetical protein